MWWRQVGGELVTEPVPFLESGAMVNTTQFGPWWDVMHFFLDSKCRDVQMPNMAIVSSTINQYI